MDALDEWTTLDERPAWVDEPLPADRRHDPFAEFDYLGRKVPHRIPLPAYLLMVARIEPARVRRVPPRAVVENGVDEAGDFALVACSCGHRPVVRAELAKCSACERYYTLIDDGSVYVTYGEMAPPPLPVARTSPSSPTTSPS